MFSAAPTRSLRDHPPLTGRERQVCYPVANPTPLPQTDRVLAGLIDMRLPLTFSPDDVALVARIIRAEVLTMAQADFPSGDATMVDAARSDVPD